MDPNPNIDRPEFTWCPTCGCNAKIVSYDYYINGVRIGERWLCLHCADGGILNSIIDLGKWELLNSKPSLEQPPTLEQPPIDK